MAKTKTPFLSLGAKGSVGGSITAQKRGAASLVREKPIPADPYSLPQAYQRWLYEDYSYLWTQQTDVVKASYRLKGSKHHRTAFQEWMSDKLFNLPDIAGMWHLDEKSGVIARDSSRNANHGTIYGASPADGVIDGAYYFDGLNDYIDCLSSPTLDLYQTFSILALVKLHPDATHRIILAHGRGANYWNGYEIAKTVENRLRVTGENAAGTITLFDQSTNAIIADNTWHPTAFTFDGTTGSLYVDGILDATAVGIFNSSDRKLYIGRRLDGTYCKGTIDHTILYSRALDATEIKRHSERRYPAQ